MSASPLAAASQRLRGRPGRPRKPQPVAVTASVLAVTARLLDVDGAALYLGCSSWSVRDWIANGTLPRVRIPLPNGGEVRRVLLDREDLDRLISLWKERPGG